MLLTIWLLLGVFNAALLFIMLLFDYSSLNPTEDPFWDWFIKNIEYVLLLIILGVIFSPIMLIVMIRAIIVYLKETKTERKKDNDK